MHSQLLLAPALLLTAGLANATDLFDPYVGKTHIPSGILLNGTLNDTNGNPEPWVVQLYAGAGECLALTVDSAPFAARLIVVAPDGSVYRDSNIPRSVAILPVPEQGWYTVQVAQIDGLPQNANFQLEYSRYSGDNVNCVPLTQPL